MDEKLPSYVKITITIEGEDSQTQIIIPKATEPILSHEIIDEPEDLRSTKRYSEQIKLNLSIEPLYPETGGLYTVINTSFGKETDG